MNVKILFYIRRYINKEIYILQVMDDHWEREINEFGAINVTGFRVLDFSRKFVRDFIDVWKREYHSQTISVSIFVNTIGIH